MIQEFVDVFMAKRGELEAKYAQEHPDGYEGIFRDVIALLNDDEWNRPHADNIHIINDGCYQGTLVFVVSNSTNSEYWVEAIGYGSCSGCDTFCAIREESGYDDPPMKSQTDQYMTLALHMVQSLKEI